MERYVRRTEPGAEKNDFNQHYYTVDEVAEILRVHPNTVRNMAHRRDFEYIKCGNTIRIAESELEKLKVERADNTKS